MDEQGRTDKKKKNREGQCGALMRHIGQPAVTHTVARRQNSGHRGPLQSPGGQRLESFSRDIL